MRREFTVKVKLAAYERCQKDGKPHCEECGLRIVGLPEYDPNKFGRSGDAKMLELEKMPFEQRRDAIYGVAAD